jgi:hypothetical protein
VLGCRCHIEHSIFDHPIKFIRASLLTAPHLVRQPEIIRSLNSLPNHTSRVPLQSSSQPICAAASYRLLPVKLRPAPPRAPETPLLARACTRSEHRSLHPARERLRRLGPVAVGEAMGTPAYHPGFPLCIQFMIPGRPS